MAAVWDHFEFLRPGWIVIGLLLLPWLLYGSYVSLVDFAPSATAIVAAGARRDRPVAGGGGSRFDLVPPGAANASSSWRSIAATAWDRRPVGERTSWSVSFSSRAGVIGWRSCRLPPNRAVCAKSLQREPSSTPPPDDAVYRRDGTDLAAAVAVARAAIPPGYLPQLVLVSDGQQTTGDLLTTARAGERPGIHHRAARRGNSRKSRWARSALAQVQSGRAVLRRSRAQRQSGGRRGVGSVPGRLARRSGRVVARRVAGRRESRDGCVNSWMNLSPLSTRRAYALRRIRSWTTTSRPACVMAAGQPRLLLIDREPETLDPLRWALEDQQIRRRRAAAQRRADVVVAIDRLRCDRPVGRAGDRSLADPIGVAPTLRRGAGRRVVDAGGRAVVRARGLLQDAAGSRPAGPQRLGTGDGKSPAWPWCW